MNQADHDLRSSSNEGVLRLEDDTYTAVLSPGRDLLPEQTIYGYIPCIGFFEVKVSEVTERRPSKGNWKGKPQDFVQFTGDRQPIR